VAYLLNFGMVALDEEGSIAIRSYAPEPLTFSSGIIGGRGDIQITAASTPIDFDAVSLSAAGSISGSANADIIDIQTQLDYIAPIDKEYLHRIANSADITLSPSDTGSHPSLTLQPYPARDSSFGVIRALSPSGWGAPATVDAYFIDLSQFDAGTTLYFEGESPDTLAVIQLGAPNSATDPVRSIRFVTNATLLLDPAVSSYDPSNSEYYGGPEFDAVTFLSTESIAVSCANLRLLGANIMSGEDIELRATGSSSATAEAAFHAKLLAGGSISLVNEFRFDWNFRHGFPCPPNVVRLGRIVLVQ
jgi:hypothetical protein